MPPRTTRCQDCGKLFSEVPGKALCDTCIRNRMSHPDRVREAVEKEGLKSPDEIAVLVGIPADDVVAILDQLELLRKEAKPEIICAHCKRKEAAQGSPYCDDCRTTLDQEFEEAARTLEEKIAIARNEDSDSKSSGMSAREALRKKRLRATDQGHRNFRR